MAARTAHGGIVRKWPRKQHFAATFGLAGLANQSPTGPEAWIGQEVDILNIRYDCIDDRRGRLRSGELVGDDIVDEVPQRGESPVGTVRREVAGAAQARNPHGIE